MKNLIKKILKEEFDDLDWVRDAVTDKLIKNENWMLVNDIDRESISEGHEIQKYLFDLGYSWGTGDLKNSLKDFCIYTIYHFGNIKDDEHIYYGDGCKSADIRISDKDIESGEHMIYYWSDLKPKTIKEENDFKWIDEPRNNPLDGLRLTTPMGRGGSGLTIKDDGGTHVTVTSSNGSSQYHRGTVKNFIRMGIWLPIESMNESNEFDWIRDVEAIESPKVSENNRYVIWLGELEGYEREQIKDWLFKNLSKCNKKPFTEANFEELAVVTFSSIPCGVGGFKDSVYEDAKDAYQTWSKYFIPLDPKKILKGVNINESQDFDWVNDIKPTLSVAFEEGLIKKGDVLTLSGELVGFDGGESIQVSDFKIEIDEIRGPNATFPSVDTSLFKPLQEKYFDHIGYDGFNVGEAMTFAYKDGELEVIDIS